MTTSSPRTSSRPRCSRPPRPGTGSRASPSRTCGGSSTPRTSPGGGAAGLLETYPTGYDAPAATGPDPDVHVSLERALGRLTARQRTVLVLRYYEDLTETETARLLGIGVGTVKSIHRQALAGCAPSPPTSAS